MPLPGQTLGDLEVITTDPAAGGEISYTADGDMIVKSAYFTLVTDATVANRRVHLTADDGTDIFFRSFSSTDHPASTTFAYSAYGGPMVTSSAAPVVAVPLPAEGLRLRKNDRLRTITTGIVAGDNYGSMTLHVERV